MTRLWKVFIWMGWFILLVPALWAQQIQQGPYHPVRERQIDMKHLIARLHIDPRAGQIEGEAELTFHPLRRLNRVELDAVGLQIRAVEWDSGKGWQPVRFEVQPRKLVLHFPRFVPQKASRIRIRYHCKPQIGAYFQPDYLDTSRWFAFSYGEGGLHSGWIPVYSDVNDKFTSEMILTVPPGNKAISNGRLIRRKELPDGQITFHWKESQPHSTYLLAFYVGPFEKVALKSAFGKIPLSLWIPEGHPRGDLSAFQETAKMIQFFSARFGYVYPWEKYDQILVPDYAIGGMEHTTVTGLRPSLLRDSRAPEDASPEFNHYFSIWNMEGLIAHELAHHWYGDNLTCLSLASIWLNESFATYAQMLWTEWKEGRAAFALYRLRALDTYLQQVKEEGWIRPLEYPYYSYPDQMYNLAMTYYKGALILHMLRFVLGDDAFFRVLSDFLSRHEFGNVDSHDLFRTILSSTGRNLEWFFEDWIRGAGYPVLEVKDRFLPEKKLLELSIRQRQPQVKGQDLFRLPVVVSVYLSGVVQRDTLWIQKEEETFWLPCEERPKFVVVDEAGDLVAEIRHPKPFSALLAQAGRSDYFGRVRALRTLAQQFADREEVYTQFKNLLFSGNEFWGLRAEVAVLLGMLRMPDVWDLYRSWQRLHDFRVRKALAIGLSRQLPGRAEEVLLSMIRKDPHPDVVATAIVALGRVNAKAHVNDLIRWMNRPSWYDEIKMACVKALGMSAAEEALAHIKPLAYPGNNQHLVLAALEAWVALKPGDPELHRLLLRYARRSPYDVQQQAVRWLGDLGIRAALPVLRQLETCGDGNLEYLARTAAERIETLNKESRRTGQR
jgi:aminopeptidase N